jgi:hypothetical protein
VLPDAHDPLDGDRVIARLAAAITTGIALAVFAVVVCAPYWLGYATFPKGRP